MSARRLIALQIIAVDEWMVESCTSTSIWKKKTFVLADICAWDFGRNISLSTVHLSYYSVTALVDEKLLYTDYKLCVDYSYTSSSLFRDFLHKLIRLVALFGTQDKCVPNNWTYCQWTLPAAISAGSETTRWCLMNGGICGKYWSFHKTYRDGDRQWTLMDWMLWGSTWNQTVVDAIMDAFSRPPRRRQPTQYSRGQCLWVLQKESASASAPTVPQGFSVFCSTSLAQLEGKGAASATKKN